MIQNFALKISWPMGWFLIGLVLLLGAAVFYYFKTLPPLTLFKRYFLTTVRAAILIGILALLARPILEWYYRRSEKPVIAVLADDSQSMRIKDRYGLRGDSLNYVLKNLASAVPQKSVDLKLFRFSENLHSFPGDTLSFSGIGTNLYFPLKAITDSLSGQNLQGIVLLSDGIYTEGSSPVVLAEENSVPIFTVGIGSPAKRKDITVRQVQTAPITYEGTEISINVFIQNNGFSGKKALVTVFRGKKQLARKTIILGKSGFEQRITLPLKPERVGRNTYQIRVQSLPGENVVENNRKFVTIRVLKRKLNVLVFGDEPDFDRHFLSVMADEIKDFKFRFLTGNGRGGYYEGQINAKMLDFADVLILKGFPIVSSSPQDVTKIFAAVTRKKIPVFWFLNDHLDPAKLAPYQKMLPFRLRGKLQSLGAGEVLLTLAGREASLTRIRDLEADNSRLWRGLPPLELWSGLRLNEHASVLLTASPDEDARAEKVPVLATFRSNGIKQIVFSAADFGFWHFQLQDDPERSTFFREFFEKCIRWLATREDLNPIQIKPTQPVFKVGEPVLFAGRVFDSFYQQIPDAEATIYIRKDSLRLEDKLSANSEGIYSGKYSGLEAGEYSYRIQARRDKKIIGKKRGKFTVVPFNAEFQNITPNFQLLRDIARKSGGKFYSPHTFIKQFSQNHFTRREKFQTREIHFSNWNYGLYLLLLFLTLEWLFRKRWGLL